jgi:hypothetical protein
MNAGTEPAEHTLTTPLARSEDAAGETKNVRPTASPSARGSNPRGIAITLLPCREYVKPLDDTANGARVRTDRPPPGPPCRRVNPLSPSDLAQAKPPPRPRRLDPGTLTTVDTVRLRPVAFPTEDDGGGEAPAGLRKKTRQSAVTGRLGGGRWRAVSGSLVRSRRTGQRRSR